MEQHGKALDATCTGLNEASNWCVICAHDGFNPEGCDCQRRPRLPPTGWKRKEFDEGRVDIIARNGNDGLHYEADPTGRQPHEPGAKLDAGKAPVLRGAIAYFPRAL